MDKKVNKNAWRLKIDAVNLQVIGCLGGNYGEIGSVSNCIDFVKCDTL